MAKLKFRATETLVGLFLFIGLGILAVLVVTFGRMGTTLNKPYELIVIFSNVSGLYSGADVLLAGAKVGFIASQPQLMKESYRVTVRLKIENQISIPRKSRFVVGSANLLGDKYIDVIPESDMDPTDVLQGGEVIEGSRAGGFDELTLRGTEVLDQLSIGLKNIQKLTQTLNEKLLNETNVQNLQETIANIKETSVSFKKSSLTLDSVLNKTDDTMTDLHAVSEKAGKAADSIQKLSKNAAEGKGPLGMLVNDKETADNLKALIYNMRKSGVLFYKDRGLPESEAKGRKTP
jgi:phospholipid/cholesterol/gamma-HCH transport system substrate-binding protein